VTTNLIANLVSRFMTDALIAVIQSVRERTHNLRIANTAVTIAELVNRTSSLPTSASGLRLINQLSNLARIITAAR